MKMFCVIFGKKANNIWEVCLVLIFTSVNVLARERAITKEDEASGKITYFCEFLWSLSLQLVLYFFTLSNNFLTNSVKWIAKTCKHVKTPILLAFPNKTWWKIPQTKIEEIFENILGYEGTKFHREHCHNETNITFNLLIIFLFIRLCKCTQYFLKIDLKLSFIKPVQIILANRNLLINNK